MLPARCWVVQHTIQQCTLCLLLVVASQTAIAARLPVIQHLYVALSTNAHRVPATSDLRVKTGASITGWLVVEAHYRGKTVYFSDAPQVRHRGKRRNTEVWSADAFGPMALQVFKVEPVIPASGLYDNTGTLDHTVDVDAQTHHPGGWHWCPIEYVETEVGDPTAHWSFRLNSQPSVGPRQHDYGTMRYSIRVMWRKQTYWSAGKAHRDKSGVLPGVTTVRVRRDNTAVGYMTELMNVPYVYGSSSPTGKLRDHQTERAVGADCADLIVYGWRRAGQNIGYTWSQGLKSHTYLTARVTDLVDGRYQQSLGRSPRFGHEVQVGDIILWRRHVAVIVEVDETGVLTPQTKILHTLSEAPQLTTLSHIGFGFDAPPFDIRRPRWKRKRRVSKVHSR